MKLDHPFLQLPVSFDAQALAQEIEALGESAWRPHPQGFPGNSALPLVSVDGDPGSDAVRGAMRPTPQLQACPYLMQVMHSLGAVWGRSRLMRLAGQAEVTPHVDINYYWREHMRVHVPIVTQPTVRFECGGAILNMAAGECWTFDTWRRHRVHNDDSRSRIHLVADTVGGPGFWQLMRNARVHDQQIPGWQPRAVQPSGATASLDYESVNLPLVMSPWEVRAHLIFLIGEADPAELLGMFEAELMVPFVRDWQALWAKHGDGGDGLAEFRVLRDAMRAQLARFEAVRLRNGVALVTAVNAIVTSNLVAQDAAAAMAPARSPAPAPTQPARTWGAAGASRIQFNTTARAAAPMSAQASVLRFDRPVIILSAPRSGSTLLFETLAKAPGLFTIGGESHRAIESVPELRPATRGFDSSRLLAADATATVIAALRRNFAEALRDREGRPPAPAAAVRLLEKTPKNSLRLPFLRQVFPDAHYIYLYREPRQVLASMIEAWQSGRFRTHPNLPGWSGDPWSLLLVPGWRDFIGRPLEEVVAHQWATTIQILMDDLQTLPPEQLSVIRYDELIAQPHVQIKQLCQRIDIAWDDPVAESLPLSRHTLSPPDPEKWRRHEAAVVRVLPLVESSRARLELLLAR